MGFWDRVKRGYKKIDRKVGGVLPGGVPRSSTPKTSSPNSTPAPNQSRAPNQSTPSSSPSSSGGGSSSSGGGRSSSSGGGGGSSSSGSSGFTGKVQQIDTKTGQVVSTSYVVNDKTVGRITGSGNNATYQPTTNKAYNLSFNRGGTSETVNLTPQEANISTSQAPTSNLSTGTRIDYSKKEKVDNGIVWSGEPLRQSYGVPTITKAEAEKYGIDPKTTPVWVMNSTNPQEAIIEGQYAGSTPYTTRAIDTKDLRISNLANIRTGQAIYQANKNNMSVDVNTVYTSSVNQARADYATLPKGERVKLAAAGVGQGVSSVVIRTAEFGGTIYSNMGVRAGTPEQLQTTYKFRFGGTVGEVANYPVPRTTGFLNNPRGYLKESFQSPSTTAGYAMVAGGVYSFARRIGSVGAKTATAETVSMFSPIRMKPGVYGAGLKPNQKFNVRSVKYTNQNTGITSRGYAGVSQGGVRMTGQERYITTPSGKTIGGGVVKTQTPFTEIRAGGAIVEQGVRTTIQPYKFTTNSPISAKGYGARGNTFLTQQITPSFPAGVSRVTTSKGVTVFQTPSRTVIYNDMSRGIVSSSGGIVSGRDKIVTDFAAGGANSIYKTTRVGDVRVNLQTGKASQDFIYQPTGRYRVNPQFRGKELDLNRLAAQYSGDKGFTSFRGGGGGTGQRFYQTTSQPTPQINSPVSSAQTGGIVRPVVAPPSSAPPAQRLQGNIARPTQAVRPRTQIIPTSSVIVAPVVATSTVTRSRGRSRQAFRQPQIAQVISPQVNIGQQPRIAQTPALNTIQASRQTLRYGVPVPNTFGAPTFAPPNIPRTPTSIVPPLIMLKGINVGANRSIITGGKRRTGYTPSFSALVFNLRGNYKGGGALSKSGLNFRPIVSGFKFKTGLNRVRIRR